MAQSAGIPAIGLTYRPRHQTIEKNRQIIKKGPRELAGLRETMSILNAHPPAHARKPNVTPQVEEPRKLLAWGDTRRPTARPPLTS
jgi:hypothetical protein